MRETREINTSLSVLKDCIRSKAKADVLASSGLKMPHIPFRQSALTKVLKHIFDPASTRACKTVVIACINPSLADVGPSKNTRCLQRCYVFQQPRRRSLIQWLP